MARFFSSLLALVLISLLFNCSFCKKNLIFIQELIRHGARYPIFPTKDLDKTDYVIN